MPLGLLLIPFKGCQKRTLYLYTVTATNLGLFRANIKTSHSVQIGPSCRWLYIVGGSAKFSDNKILKTTTVGPLQFSYYTALLPKPMKSINDLILMNK